MSAGASAAAAAAAEQARRQREEEEEMTAYSQVDLNEGWEFKILRSATGAFKDPDQFRLALEEEGRAGWVLVEKFDNQRLRLKRPASAKNLDGKLDFDAYRTTFGASEGVVAMRIAGVVILVIVLVLVLIGVLVSLRR